MALRRDVERLADGEEADGERRHLDAVEQFRHAEGQARLAGELVDADEPERDAQEQAGQPAQRRIAEGGRDGDEGQDHQPEIVPGPEFHRELDQPGRQEGQAQSRDQARDEGADGRGRQRRPAAPGLGHFGAFERRRQRGALARRVQQDGGGRAAIHAAVIDAGEHDQRARRIELEGHGQAAAPLSAPGRCPAARRRRCRGRRRSGRTAASTARARPRNR